MTPGSSSLLAGGFTALTLTVSAIVPLTLYRAMRRRGHPRGARRAAAWRLGAAIAVWLALTYAVADLGVLASASPLFRLAPLLAVSLLLAVALAASPTGRRLAGGLPTAALVGAQGFRLPLAFLLALGFAEGTLPERLSLAGVHLDVLAGASAVGISVLLSAGAFPLRWVAPWNAAGATLLAALLVPGFAKAPETLGTGAWAAHPPFVWLLTVLVPLALLGHLLLFRRLREERRSAGEAPAAERAPQRASVGA